MSEEAMRRMMRANVFRLRLGLERALDARVFIERVAAPTCAQIGGPASE